MQNIQDLKEKIFFESRNIIGILDKISHVDELSSKLDLVEELAERISFLRLLEKNIAYFGNENFSPVPENNENFYRSAENSEVTEEEAIFNNELNEINENRSGNYSGQVTEEEAVFNNQLNEIVEEELHETLVNFAEENKEADLQEVLNENADIFNGQPDENSPSESPDSNKEPVHFSEEEKTPADLEDETRDEIFHEKKTEEEAVFNNQLNEIDEFENEISDNDGEISNSFEEEERILNNFESASEKKEYPNEESHNPLFSSQMMEQGEMASDTSGAENIINDLKNEASEEERQKEAASEEHDRRAVSDFGTPVSEVREERKPDESFESLEAYNAYNHERKIKLANIRGLKAVQSFFDEEHPEREHPEEKSVPAEKKEETGSILKTNIPTDFMEAEKKKPEFKLDLNDRIAFSKMLFGGSQSELNEVVANLNSFKTLEEAKEYLSDLYYSRKWNKVDEYAQRLWILVENKFL
ncbi:hypothetical protein [Chryseobacterium hagamense]|uniref:Uncharacterized protein n=1 Tax=Chryseobacterium hagamense TaxID=395935 RepID=A0A511YK76_9FLAO|nr:hypothetical protein [Chryseobacterium hagamense]GEN75605.1 hypothetical protein CHA01nite_13450 [Chryseobacterium hagamense]